MMLRAAIAAGAAVLVVGMASAATVTGDPVESRQTLMKNVGAAAAFAGAMVRGETEYEPDAAQVAMRTLNSSIIGFVELLPEGSHQGDTRALPEIWENWGDFLDRAQAMRDATQAAIDAEPEDLESFRQLFANVGTTCRNCHENYRLPED